VQTIGELVDKLTIVNLKLFAVQDQVYEAAGQEPDDYAARSPAETQEIFRKVAALNLDRNNLIREIDQALAQAVTTGTVPVASNVKVVS